MAAEAASDMKVRVKQRCPWIPLCRKKWHLLTFTNACWALMETKQWTWAHSEAVGDVFQQWWQQHERQAMFQMATHSCHTTEWRASQSPNPGELVDFRVLCKELNTILNVLETIVAIMEYRKVCSRWVSWLLTLEQKEHCMQLCQDLLNQHKAEGDGFLVSLPVTSCGVTLRAGVKMAVQGVSMWIPHWRKSALCSPQHLKWCALSFWDRKGVILFGVPGTQANHQLWRLHHNAD